MKSTGKTLFWVGFLITIGIIIAYIILMIIDVTAFTTWVTSLSLCGIVLIGAILMLMGRSMERRAGDDV